MVSVNMIAARRAERLRLARATRVLSFGVCTAAALLVAVVAVMGGRILNVKFATARVEADLVKLQPTIERINAINRERALLQPQIAVLGDAVKNTMRWHGVMADLQRSIPPQTWLTNLSVERQAEGQERLRLNGVTVSQKLVGEAMLRLNQNQLYNGVDLHFTQSGKLGERETVEFELAAHLKPMKEQINEVAQAQTQ
jgi:Tfp pilus assembly protein PilN